MRTPEPFPVPAVSELVASMEEPCLIAAVVSIVGKKWTLLVLREAFSGVTQFDEFLCRTGCSSTILSLRLKALVMYGILRRMPYQEPGDCVRDAYRLTRADVDLLPAIVAFMQWGDRYLTPDGEGPMLLRDRGSGTPVHVVLINALSEPITPKNSMRECNSRYERGEDHAATAADTPPTNGQHTILQARHNPLSSGMNGQTAAFDPVFQFIPRLAAIG